VLIDRDLEPSFADRGVCPTTLISISIQTSMSIDTSLNIIYRLIPIFDVLWYIAAAERQSEKCHLD
jgi:hypothetical protein